MRNVKTLPMINQQLPLNFIGSARQALCHLDAKRTSVREEPLLEKVPAN